MLLTVPAVSVVGKPVTFRAAAAAACTAMAVSVPVTLALVVLITLRLWAPAVTRVAEKECVPASAAVNV